MRTTIFEFLTPESEKSKVHYVKSNVDIEKTALAFQAITGEKPTSGKDYCTAGEAEKSGMSYDAIIISLI